MQKITEYTLGECIGSGMYGTIYKGTSAKRPGEVYAIKQISRADMSDKVMERFDREVDILALFDSEHVIRLRDLRATVDHYFLIFEYCNGGDLLAYRSKKGGRLDERKVRFIAKQIVAGMNELYTKKAIHRDLKLSNLLLHYPDAESRAEDRPIVKLGDFGFSRLITEVEGSDQSSCVPRIMSFVGTPLNMAPELFHKQPYSFKADIWSLGTVVYELLCGCNCFTGSDKDDLMLNIDRGLYKLPKSLNASCECLDFLNACLQFDANCRIAWTLVMSHPFVVSESYTPFNVEQFKTFNSSLGHVPEDAHHFIFSSKARAVFGLSLPVSDGAAEFTGVQEDEKAVPEPPQFFEPLKTVELPQPLATSSDIQSQQAAGHKETWSSQLSLLHGTPTTSADEPQDATAVNKQVKGKQAVMQH